MFRIICALLFCLGVLPAAVYGAEDSQKTYLVTKDKLECLYKEINSLLKESEPVVVFLSRECAQPPTQPDSRERTPLPVPEPKIGPHVTLKPEDMLILSHAQLQCFKQAFAKLMMQTMEPVSIRFTSNCAIDSNYKP